VCRRPLSSSPRARVEPPGGDLVGPDAGIANREEGPHVGQKALAPPGNICRGLHAINASCTSRARR